MRTVPLTERDVDEFRWAFENRANASLGSRQPYASPWVIAQQWTNGPATDLAWLAGVFVAPPSRGGKPEPWLVTGIYRASRDGRSLLLCEIGVSHLESYLDKRKAARIEVTSHVLRLLPLARMQKHGLRLLEDRRELLDIFERMGLSVTKRERRRADVVVRAAKQTELAEPTPRRGRPPLDPSIYVDVAYDYLDLADNKAFIREMCERAESRLGRDVPPQTMRTWIKRCRELGYLATTSRGKPKPGRGPNLPPKKEGKR